MKHSFHWTGKTPYPVSAPRPEGMTLQILRRPTDALPFLHDTSVSRCGEGLFAAWYTCTEGEIAGETCIMGRYSPDGVHWDPVETVVGGTDYHYVPASFYTANGQFRALVTTMTGHDRPVSVMELARTENGWQRLREHSIPFLFNTAPVSLPNGTLLAAGRIAPEVGELPRIPAVARKIPCCEDWQVFPMPGDWKSMGYPLPIPETTLLCHGNSIETIVRNDRGSPWVFCTEDPVENWHFAGESVLPIAGVKMYSGTLPDGRLFLLYNEITPAKDRSRLVMALGSSEGFDRLYTLADGYDSVAEAGPYWHYPWAAEKDDMLYVTCTANGPANRRSAVLFTIPLKVL